MSIVLHYFDGWGRAERIRWLLWIHNQEFTEKTYEWEEWLSQRDSTELGQLPLLEIDGHSMVQSLAIERFIARKLAIVPQDSFQEYLVDSTLGAFDDYFRHFAQFLVYTDNLEGYIQYYNEELKRNLGFIEKRIETNGNPGFIVGNSLTLADLAVAEFVQDIFLSGPRKATLGPLITEGNPKLVEFTKNFINQWPVLVTRVSSRSDKDF
jgi:glutathione S-transferase